MPERGNLMRGTVAGGIGAAYLGTILAANWAITVFGAIPIGLGLMAPAGALFAGLAFTLRDLLDDAGGRRWVLGAILTGVGLSFAVAAPAVALASAVAFGVSELVDWAVYTPLRRRRWLLAVAVSNAVGLVVDSVLFLWLAFGSQALLPGQIVAKGAVTLFAVGVLAAGRSWRRRAVA